MQCPQCKADVDAQSLFCPQCGTQLAGEAADRDEPTASEKFRQAVGSRQDTADDDEEESLWQGRYSWKAMIGVWIGAGLLTLIALITGALLQFSTNGWGFLIGTIVCIWIGLLLSFVIKRFGVHYTVTNHRFLHERGILWRTVDRLELIDVGDITFKQGPIERMVNVGSILLTSSDPTHPSLAIPGIEDVRAVSGIIDRQRREERKRRGLHIHNV
jgi:membrane protein YdbS with pleckstrin-like domain